MTLVTFLKALTTTKTLLCRRAVNCKIAETVCEIQWDKGLSKHGMILYETRESVIQVIFSEND